ncbi:uncharacterized protein [Ptychodera flava]|uniref:uncharacterized protein n=1 Tax=Ptychodera flava TaxID=63121 RepID=UPI00396A4B44
MRWFRRVSIRIRRLTLVSVCLFICYPLLMKMVVHRSGENPYGRAAVFYDGGDNTTSKRVEISLETKQLVSHSDELDNNVGRRNTSPKRRNHSSRPGRVNSNRRRKHHQRFQKFSGTWEKLQSGTYTLSSATHHSMPDRYLFPIVNFDGGPNFQYRQLKVAIQLAVYTNRTIVMPEFNHQRLLPDVGRVSFAETFEIAVFKQFIPAVSIEEYLEKCAAVDKVVIKVPKMATLVGMPDLHERYTWQRTWLRDMYNITIPDQRTFKTPGSKMKKVLRRMSEEKCLVMVLPLAFENTEILQNGDIAEGADQHLVRTPPLREAVSDILHSLCNDRPLLSLHWRNKTGEVCSIGRLSVRRSPRCLDLQQVHENLTYSLSLYLQRIARDNNIGCMYVAYPPTESANIIHLLRSNNLSNILTIDDVMALHHPYIESLNGDDYFISLVEQEISARSRVFVGNGKSNWSTFVFQERRAFSYGPNFDILTDFAELSDAMQHRF